jgi:N-acetyl-anhydromuramyl-L-alanine amidase AmpD
MLIIDTPTRRVLPWRTGPVRAVIIHATGETDLDRCLAWYTNPNGYQPHYFITATGTIRRIADEKRIAYHAAIEKLEGQMYREGWSRWSRHAWRGGVPVDVGVEFSGYSAWREQWRNGAGALDSPLDLVTGEKPNAVSLGIEVQSLDKPTAELFAPEQYIALLELLDDVCARHKIPRHDRRHILAHYDVSPMRRSTVRGSFDPDARFDWRRVIG